MGRGWGRGNSQALAMVRARVTEGVSLPAVASDNTVLCVLTYVFLRLINYGLISIAKFNVL